MITYDEINGLIYISLQHQPDGEDKPALKSIEVDDGLIVDYDEDTDRAIGIEIIDPDRAEYLYEAIQDFVRKGN